MSKIKNYYLRRIEELAELTGYAFDFLFDLWDKELLDGDADFEYFEAVTLELDW